MPLLFKNTGQQQVFYRNPISACDLNSAELKESTDTIALDNAGMLFGNWCFEGFRLAYNVFDQQSATSYAVKNDIDAIKIYFNTSGRTLIDYRQLSKQFAVSGGQCNMLYSAELDSRLSHLDDHSEMFSLQITKDCFLQLAGRGDTALGRFADAATKGIPVLFSGQWLPISSSMEKCIREIMHCHFTGDLKKLYLRSKALELFVLFADVLSAKPEEESRFLRNAADREKLYQVRDYLLQHYATPISLAALARFSGLNEFKLKNGFRALFHTSVIDFLLSHRLERARDLLLHTSLNVSEVAYETGYASPAYFSKAFKKKYGITPKKQS